MNLIKVSCAFCGKKFFRPRSRFNEAKKFDWKQFCSTSCLAKSKITGKILHCSNPKCNKKFYRVSNQLKKSKSGGIFCSRSCAAIINNLARRINRTCQICGRKFCGKNKYCSRSCYIRSLQLRPKIIKITKNQIINRIKKFYALQGRIPIKKEINYCKAARLRFGSWNKAIRAAGFEPNPVKFARKHIANDGHKCDSFSEKVIDDWLYSKKIKHQRNIPYPDGSYTADFLVGNKFTEFFGLTGELVKYDKNAEIKHGIAQKYKIDLIEIYPKDLFPISHLGKIIKID